MDLEGPVPPRQRCRAPSDLGSIGRHVACVTPPATVRTAYARRCRAAPAGAPAGGTLNTGRPQDLGDSSPGRRFERVARKVALLSDRERADAAEMASVTKDLVRLHSEYYGKGPTKAHSYMVSDTVVSILEGGFTTVEATLIAEGKSRAVHEVRRSFQAAMEDRFRGVVESATGRRVIAYLSQTHTDPDLAVELFVLDGTAEKTASG
jgi:uncharacterized protein YbcI